MLIEISKKAVESKSCEYWNKFNSALSMAETGNTVGLFRSCHLIYWYGSEVMNGGHFQYFSNKEYFNHQEVISALEFFSLYEFSTILKNSLPIIEALDAEEVSTEYEEYIQNLIEKSDDQFHNVSPDIFKCLESIQKIYEKDLVVWKE